MPGRGRVSESMPMTRDAIAVSMIEGSSVGVTKESRVSEYQSEEGQRRMRLVYTAPHDQQPDQKPEQEIETFLSFWQLRADQLVLVRLLHNPRGNGSMDIACAQNGADLMRLIRKAARERYVAPDGTPRIFQGCYARLCHSLPSRDWLDTHDWPKLTAATAVSYPGFFIDIDPVKEVAGGSSSDAELQETQRVADEISGWLDSVLGLDRSYALRVMSGNGTQICIRVAMDMDDAGLARMLLMRMQGRWPAVDPSGSKMSVGPAIPGTLKCKGIATPDRPHRMVRILESCEGDRRLTADDLRTLIATLPEVENEIEVTHHESRAWDAYTAVAALPIADVLEQLFGERSICPVCKSTDGAVAVTEHNVLVCQHARSCPAGAKKGFKATHAFGVRLGFGWRDYTLEQRADIIEAAQACGWELTWDETEEKKYPELTAELAPWVESLFAPTPSIHCTVEVDPKPWFLRSKNTLEVAKEPLYKVLVRAYCPDLDYKVDRPLTMTGKLMIYHQGLGIYVPITTTDESDLNRIYRILGDQETKGGGIFTPARKGEPPAWAPPPEAVLKALEMEVGKPKFFTEPDAKVGLACKDGFLELQKNGQWRQLPHSHLNRARGRIARTCGQVLREIESGQANHAEQALRAIIDCTLHRDGDTSLCDSADVDDVLRIFLAEVGAVLCGLKPELRRAIFIHGSEDTGKSSLLRIAAAMIRKLGLKVSSASINDLNQSFPPETLLDAAANIKEDEGAFDTGRRIQTERFKQVVEGSPWTFARKNQSSINVCIQPLWMAASNADTSIAEASGAVAKRCHIIQYPTTPTAPDKLDRTMVQRFLDAHLDGLISASLVGAARLQRDGRTNLRADSKIARHTRELGRSQSLVEAWLETVDVSNNDGNDTPLSEALKACNRWGEQSGYRAEAATNNPVRFGREIARLVRKSRKSNGRTMVPVMLPRFDPEASDASKL